MTQFGFAFPETAANYEYASGLGTRLQGRRERVEDVVSVKT